MKADGLHHLLYPMITLLITSHDGRGKGNVMAANWVMPVSFDPFMVAIAIGKGRFTHELILKTKEFAICLPHEKMAEQVAFCGSWSGWKTDKFAEAELAAEKATRIGAPLVGDCIASLECRVIRTADAGDHTLFIGEVLAVHEAKTRKKKLFYSGEMRFFGL